MVGSSIRRLSDGTINRIAAGEVVERAASAIKELVENALDAGATSIRITIEGGGRDLILVEDNGHGISPEDLPLAIERHATSKLPLHEDQDDLFSIQTLGFRGEALASIASIARLRITSKTAESPTAYTIYSENGILKDPPLAVAGRLGTRIEVRDLFYTTPARLKFLKSERTELQAIKEHILRLALAHPHVSFALFQGEKPLFQHGASGEIPERLSAVLGKDFLDNHFSFEAERDGYSLRGYSGKPALFRNNANSCYFFVNNRFVKDKMVVSILKAAYQGFMEREHHPVGVFFLQTPLDRVDVNVHPAKIEVRFSESDKIRSLFLHTVKQALEYHTQFTAPAASNALFEKLSPSSSPTTFTLTEDLPTSAVHEGERAYHSLAPAPHRSSYGSLGRSSAPSFSSLPASPSPLRPSPPPPPLPSLPLPHMETMPPLGYAKAQIGSTYIVAENEQGLVLVDQHAAHERITLEKIKGSLQNGDRLTAQPLLIPEVIDLTSEQSIALLENQGALEKFGFTYEPFGIKGIMVREAPLLLSHYSTTALMRKIADDLVAFEVSFALEEKINHILSTIACHHSIRAGRKLSIEEMNALLREMEATPHTGHCNHGRPTTLSLSLKDIEKLFGR